MGGDEKLMDAKSAITQLTKFPGHMGGSGIVALTVAEANDIADLISRQQAVCDAAKEYVQTNTCTAPEVVCKYPTPCVRYVLCNAMKRLEDKPNGY